MGLRGHACPGGGSGGIGSIGHHRHPDGAGIGGSGEGGEGGSGDGTSSPRAQSIGEPLAMAALMLVKLRSSVWPVMGAMSLKRFAAGGGASRSHSSSAPNSSSSQRSHSSSAPDSASSNRCGGEGSAEGGGGPSGCGAMNGGGMPGVASANCSSVHAASREVAANGASSLRASSRMRCAVE